MTMTVNSPSSAPMPPSASQETLADLIDELDNVSPYRILRFPFPGTASEADFLYANEQLGILCELINGTLVEKPMGNRESYLAQMISHLLLSFVLPRRLGYVLGPDSMFRFVKQVRMPDVAFISNDRWPNGLPKTPVSDIAPDLAVEILSASNTTAEMKRKRHQHFAQGVKLVWIVDPTDQTVAVYTTEEPPTIVRLGDVLDGGIALPGLSIPVSDIFAGLQ